MAADQTWIWFLLILSIQIFHPISAASPDQETSNKSVPDESDTQTENPEGSAMPQSKLPSEDSQPTKSIEDLPTRRILFNIPGRTHTYDQYHMGSMLPVKTYLPSVVPITEDSTEKQKEKSISLNSVGYTERKMILGPEKKNEYPWMARNVYVKAQQIQLKKETGDYVKQLNRRYDDLPALETDNVLWRKFSRAVVENFVLDFYSRFVVNPLRTKWANAEEDEGASYNETFDEALSNLRSKKGQTALQFASPVRRAADIFRSIIDTPTGIVQSKCKSGELEFLCQSMYLVGLVEESNICPHIWFHAQVHITALNLEIQLRNYKNAADEVIDELESKIALQESNNVGDLFDYIVNTIKALKRRIQESLIVRSTLYRTVKEYQRQNALQCLTIDHKL